MVTAPGCPFLLVARPKGKVITAPSICRMLWLPHWRLQIPKPLTLSVQNLLPLAKGKTKASKHREIYGAYLDAQRSITINYHKLIVYPKARFSAYMIWQRLTGNE